MSSATIKYGKTRLARFYAKRAYSYEWCTAKGALNSTRILPRAGIVKI